MNKGQWFQLKRNFFAGLAVVLPAALSIFVVLWLFGIVRGFTDALLIFVPTRWRIDPGTGQMYWYWSLFAFVVAIGLIVMVGRLTRHYVGKKIIQAADSVILRVPLLNKIYAAVKQVNEALTSGNRSSFKQVVLIEFPRPGIYSVGFITNEHHEEVQARTKEKIVSVFVPTTPNPTSGYLALVPEDKIIRLQMPVSDGVKFIISLGSVVPSYPGGGAIQISSAPPAPHVHIHTPENIASPS